MNTKQTFATMEKALPFVIELIRDEEVAGFKTKMKEDSDTTMGEAIETMMSVFLIRKRDTVLNLLSIVTGKSVKEIEEQEYSETKKDMQHMLLGDFFDFFTWSLRMATKA